MAKTSSFPQITAHSSASLVAEGGAIGESDPTSASITLGAFKYAYLVQVSSELLADEGVDIEGFLAQRHWSCIRKWSWC